MGDLETTQPDLETVLDLVKTRADSPCLEVETYTWDVLPPEYRTAEMSEAIARELAWTTRERAGSVNRRRRSRPRAYLLLARISNLPTVWTNVLAAYVVAGASRESLPIASIAASLFYTAGMFLNDAFDAPFDAQARADRPIPTAMCHGTKCSRSASR